MIQLVQRIIDLGKKSRIPFLDDDIVRIFRKKFYLLFMDAAPERTLHDGIDLTLLEGDVHVFYAFINHRLIGEVHRLRKIGNVFILCIAFHQPDTKTFVGAIIPRYHRPVIFPYKQRCAKEPDRTGKIILFLALLCFIREGYHIDLPIIEHAEHLRPALIVAHILIAHIQVARHVAKQIVSVAALFSPFIDHMQSIGREKAHTDRLPPGLLFVIRIRRPYTCRQHQHRQYHVQKSFDWMHIDLP